MLCCSRCVSFCGRVHAPAAQVATRRSRGTASTVHRHRKQLVFVVLISLDREPASLPGCLLETCCRQDRLLIATFLLICSGIKQRSVDFPIATMKNKRVLLNAFVFLCRHCIRSPIFLHSFSLESRHTYNYVHSKHRHPQRAYESNQPPCLTSELGGVSTRASTCCRYFLESRATPVRTNVFRQTAYLPD